MTELLHEKLAALTQAPGCYLMKNAHQEIIYVGKAKNLYKRVNSYFQKSHCGKTQKMVSEVADFDVIITNTEKEAFILELNLVQLHDPRYNVLLKDGKTYPYIQIQKGQHPTIKIARNTKDKQSIYYGPYPDSRVAFSILFLLQQLFPLRKCRNLPKKACLYYHLGQCLAPCIQFVSSDRYEKILNDIQQFMNGNTAKIRLELQRKMEMHAEALRFEQANEVKKILESIQYMQSGQSVQLMKMQDTDVFAYHANNDYLSIATLIVRGGKLLTKINEIVALYGEEEEVFSSYIMQFYSRNLIPKTIALHPFEDSALLADTLMTKIVSPTRGSIHDLLMMAAQNAIKGMEENQLKLLVPGGDNNEVLEELASRLDISYPKQIDFIDNSHLAGENFVGAVVVFVHGVPNKKLYRKYRIQSPFKGADDKAMYEIVYRRFYRQLAEKILPSDLLLVDGGFLQIRAAKEALHALQIDIPVFGLVKDNRHRTSGLVDEHQQEIQIKDYPKLLFLLTKMQ